MGWGRHRSIDLQNSSWGLYITGPAYADPWEPSWSRHAPSQSRTVTVTARRAVLLLPTVTGDRFDRRAPRWAGADILGSRYASNSTQPLKCERAFLGARSRLSSPKRTAGFRRSAEWSIIPSTGKRRPENVFLRVVLKWTEVGRSATPSTPLYTAVSRPTDASRPL